MGPSMPDPVSSQSSPASTTSEDVDDILPTPLMGADEVVPSGHGRDAGKKNRDEPDIFSPVVASGSDSPAIPSATRWASTHDPAPSLNRTFSTSRSASRAPAPPPIFLRQPTEVAVPSVKGLNIDLHDRRPSHGFLQVDDGEENDGVPDLMPTPRRAAFNAALTQGDGAPLSPAWQSFDSPGARHLPSFGSATGSRVPPSPLVGYSPRPPTYPHSPMLASPSPPRPGKRFDPTPTHGIHARNLSFFFPQPGQGQGHGLGLPLSQDPQEEAGTQVIPPGARRPFGGQGEWSFGASAHAGEAGAQARGLASPEAKSKRRGHHHKHSLSHNFFSFLDPTVTNPTLGTSASSPHIPAAPSPKPLDAPQSVPMPLNSTLSVGSPTLSPLPRASDPMSQLLASFAVLEFLIGSALWVEGQMGGWRCLAGVGYLVVFDAIGVGVGVVARGGEGWRSVRRPYGTTRFLSLLYFSQSLFLVFAAVYIAKESIEQVVLGASGNEHGGHGHGHGHADLDGEERPFPTFLLVCAVLASAIGGGVMHTHAKLVDAVGSLFLSPKYLESPIVRKFPHLLANPFSVTVMGSSAAVLIGTMIVPVTSLHTFDALAALLLTVLTTALSLPASKAFGQVLLQTAPPSSSVQMKNLQRAIKEIRSDHRIRNIAQTRCWAITAGSAPPPPPPPSYDFTPSSSPMGSRQASYSRPNHSPQTSYSSPHIDSPTKASAWHSPSASPTVGEFGGIHPSQYPSLLKNESDAPLVLTMEVEVDEDLGDREVLEITRAVWTKLGRVCRGGSKGRMGEVSVGVKRVKRSMI